MRQTTSQYICRTKRSGSEGIQCEKDLLYLLRLDTHDCTLSHFTGRVAVFKAPSNGHVLGHMHTCDSHDLSWIRGVVELLVGHYQPLLNRLAVALTFRERRVSGG